jgi:hypothetical protein
MTQTTTSDSTQDAGESVPLDAAYIRYSSEVEHDDPDFAQTLQAVLERAKRHVAESVQAEGSGRAVRDAHAKGYGLARAEVEILAGLPAAYAQGVYATPGHHEALIRFSNGSPHIGADMLLGPSAGMGLKIFGINGPTLLEDEADSGTMDYANINAPVFFANSVEHYTFIVELFLSPLPSIGATHAQTRQRLHRFLYNFLTGMGQLPTEEWVWDELLAFLSLRRIKPINVLLSTYWTMGAVRHGAYIAKVRMAPVPHYAAQVTRRDLDLASAPDVYRPALVEELREHAYEFNIQVQLCTDVEQMPVEDLTVEWPERLSPFVTVAKLRLPQQEIEGEAIFEAMDAISINPWRCPEEHRPLGNIQRARKEAYRQSSILRHQLNRQVRQEPQNLAAIFGA